MTDTVEIRPAAAKALRKLPRDIQVRLRPHIDGLAKNPRPTGCEKLLGLEKRYRIRVGDYRLIYDIHDAVLVVVLIKLGHRREVYRLA